MNSDSSNIVYGVAAVHQTMLLLKELFSLAALAAHLEHLHSEDEVTALEKYERSTFKEREIIIDRGWENEVVRYVKTVDGLR